MRMDDDELERSDEVDMWQFGYKNVLADANTTAQPLPLALPHGANRSAIVARGPRERRTRGLPGCVPPGGLLPGRRAVIPFGLD